MQIDRQVVTLAVNSSGALTTYTERVTGRVLQIRYVVDGTIPLDTGADLTITGEDSGVAIATLTDIGTSSFTKAPRQATHAVTGAAALYAGSGQPVNDTVAVAGERLKVVVAQGGTSKTGTLHIYVG